MINHVKTENSFNKLLRQGIKNAENVSFLFTSPYDVASRNLVKEIRKGNHKLRRTLHVVDSFETPHAFVACKTTQVPCFVDVKHRKKNVEYYLPFIYEKLGVSLP
jgi:hypothetical protein